MSTQGPKLSKDRDEVILKFKELIEKAETLCSIHRKVIDEGGNLPADKYFELKVSSINLLSRLSSDQSIYVRELMLAPSSGIVDPNSLKGVLEGARTDYLQGFMADHKLLISAEVFADLLVQAEVLLDHDWLLAAAVTIRAVLEEGMRKLCEAHKIEIEKGDNIQKLNEKLYKKGAYTKLHHQEIVAKATVGNDAAHKTPAWEKHKKEDVAAFLEFVLRFLNQYLK